MEKKQLAVLAETHALKVFCFALIATMTPEHRARAASAISDICEASTQYPKDDIKKAAAPIIQKFLDALA